MAATAKSSSKSLDTIEEFPDVIPDTSTMFKKWIWKDETNSLEQISTGLQPSSDRQVINFGKMKKGYKTAPGKGISNLTQLKPKKVLPTGKLSSPNPSLKLQTKQKRSITLDDVKGVSFDLMADNCEIADHFHQSLRENHFDELLAILLYYFDAFLDKVALERKPKVMGSELSSSEKKACSMVMERLVKSQKLLAEKYCILILGLDTEEQHHMACGKQRKSYTKRDKDFYENLYSYCCLVVWVTFRRTDFELIQEELGRLFRSPAFNPHGKPVDNNEFKLASDLKNLDIQEISLTPSSVRKIKRPIMSILNQRSPILVSLFPNSKESASWLLDRRTALALHNRKEVSKEEIFQEVDLRKLNVGIIGEMVSGANSYTLPPYGDDVEDEKDDRKMSYTVSTKDETFDLEVEGESQN